MLAVDMKRHGDAIALVDHAVNGTWWHDQDVAGAEHLLALDPDFGVTRPRAVIEALPEYVLLGAVDPADNGPGPVVVRWRAASREPRADQDREAVIGLLVEEMSAESLLGVASIGAAWQTSGVGGMRIIYRIA
jgi:hypothetical protein